MTPIDTVTLDPGRRSVVDTTPVAADRPAPLLLDLRSHHALGGAYTAGGQLVRRMVGELVAVDPALARPAATAVIAIAPDLSGQAPARPQTLTDLAEDNERTRFYPVSRTHDLAYLVSDLVRVWAAHCHPHGVTLRLWDLAEADATDLELVDMLRRRNAADGVVTVDAGRTPTEVPGGADLAQAYLEADGTCDDPVLREAYEALTAVDRAARHSRRAADLIERGAPADAYGAIPYHLEHGSDPAEALPWLLAAQKHSFRESFYGAALDFARRGRALTNWEHDPASYNFLTKRMIGSLTYLGRCDEAMAVILEHRQTTFEIATQMNDAYMMAMIYTRHIEPARIDQRLALAWINTAIALADGEPDPHQRTFFRAFMRNARALVVLHLGDLPQALDLVNSAIDIAADLGSAHALHRSVLLTNRARVLMALGRPNEALVAFDDVLQLDPEYDDAYFERAVAHRAVGDLDAALADLDRAIELSPAFTDAYYNRADIHTDLGDTERSMADLDMLLDIDPDYLSGRINRAVLRMGRGDLDGADRDLALGLLTGPADPGLWSAVGLLRTEQGREIEASEAFDQALRLDDRLVAAWVNRAVLRFSAGQVGDAVTDLDRAIELTDTPTLRVNRGIGRHELGDLVGAIRDFDTALDAEATNPGQIDEAEVLFRRGLSRFELDDLPGAEDDWARYVRLVTESAESAEHLEEIAARTEGSPTFGSLLARGDLGVR